MTVAGIAVGEREEAPACGTKPPASPEAQEQIAAITAELAAAGATVRWH